MRLDIPELLPHDMIIYNDNATDILTHWSNSNLAEAYATITHGNGNADLVNADTWRILTTKNGPHFNDHLRAKITIPSLDASVTNRILILGVPIEIPASMPGIGLWYNSSIDAAMPHFDLDEGTILPMLIKGGDTCTKSTDGDFNSADMYIPEHTKLGGSSNKTWRPSYQVLPSTLNTVMDQDDTNDTISSRQSAQSQGRIYITKKIEDENKTQYYWLCYALVNASDAGHLRINYILASFNYSLFKEPIRKMQSLG